MLMFMRVSVFVAAFMRRLLARLAARFAAVGWFCLHGDVADAVRPNGSLHLFGQRVGFRHGQAAVHNHMAGHGVFFAGNRPGVQVVYAQYTVDFLDVFGNLHQIRAFGRTFHQNVQAA